ncbi:phosphate transport system permease protein [Clostridia bacterium]|nr:phosphate transport system permease protein [Clostridia bacterium]
MNKNDAAKSGVNNTANSEANMVNKSNRTRNPRVRSAMEAAMRIVFLFAACACVLCVGLICAFLLANGVPAIAKIGPMQFLLGTRWKPGQDLYGTLPMILGSLYVTAGAVAIGVPIGVLTAAYLARFSNRSLYRVISPIISLMAGIPSVVYGFFGMVALVPISRLWFGAGKSVLTASILLGIMILPTVIRVSEAAIRAVPDSYYEGALALGASHERGVFFAVLPAARSGIMAAIVLGIGRAIGETMAVIMVAGNQAVIPQSLADGVRTLTANIALEMGYAADLHREALIGCAVVLFVFILLINLLLSVVQRRRA